MGSDANIEAEDPLMNPIKPPMPTNTPKPMLNNWLMFCRSNCCQYCKGKLLLDSVGNFCSLRASEETQAPQVLSHLMRLSTCCCPRALCMLVKRRFGLVELIYSIVKLWHIVRHLNIIKKTSLQTWQLV
jgi:hypothetical protein